MDDEMLYGSENNSDSKSDSIDVIIEKQEDEKCLNDELPQIDGQAIYDFEIDNMEEKPWLKPGADITDYFNYGFNENTWRQYCASQREHVKGRSSNYNDRPTTTDHHRNDDNYRRDSQYTRRPSSTRRNYDRNPQYESRR